MKLGFENHHFENDVFFLLQTYKCQLDILLKVSFSKVSHKTEFEIRWFLVHFKIGMGMATSKRVLYVMVQFFLCDHILYCLSNRPVELYNTRGGENFDAKICGNENYGSLQVSVRTYAMCSLRMKCRADSEENL